MTEPFGYFKAEPFGWTDCAETDEGAVALYERPPVQQEVDLSGLKPTTQEVVKGWIEDGTFIKRAISAMQEQEAENMRLEKMVKDQPAQQEEPVIWAISYDGKTPYAIWFDGDGALLDLEIKRLGGTACKMPLYTSSTAQRPWVGLTKEERDELWYRFGYMDLMIAIEAKLKEKNK